MKTKDLLNLLLFGPLASIALAACGGTAPAAPTNAAVAPTDAAARPTAADAMAGMNHGGMNASAPFDAQFIDSMVVHHQGAIDMAEEALQKAQRPEIKQLANEIIKAQESEITQMQDWRKAWYPELNDTGGTMTGMGDMVVKDGSEPYDIRFIDAMIPHHQSAIDMANEALTKAEKPEIRTLAGDIISAQTAEIAQMTKWRTEWTMNTGVINAMAT